jgi:hypothetical protein
MTGASIVPTSGQPAPGFSLPFERELLFEDLRDAGGTVLDRTPLPQWNEVVADWNEHDIVETLRSGTVPTCTRFGR